MDMSARKYHLVGIGEDQMVALALALKASGHEVSGSDASVSPKAEQALKAQGLSASSNWNINGMAKEDVVVFKQSAGSDNPAIAKAKELGCQILTVAQLIKSVTVDQQRIVISGKLKSLITSIVLFVLESFKRRFDHFANTSNDMDEAVKLNGNPLIIVEATSELGDLTDYHHHIAVISGGEDEKTLEPFANASPKGGSLIFNAHDPVTNRIGSKERVDVNQIPFKVPPHEVRDGKVILTEPKEAVVVQLKGEDQLLALSGARELLKRIGITSDQFFSTIGDYLP
ncbi:MAG: Mur ligase domain-containing protein [Cyclobacteriaceae bacterium]